MQPDFTLDLADENATLGFGQVLAKVLVPNLTIYLHGNLGTGKTTLVRGLLRALGYKGHVKSPTYTLVESYLISNLRIYHFDLYRFNDEEEWESAGFRDYFNAQSICVIEWPEQAQNILPMPDLNIYLSIKKMEKTAFPGRNIKIISPTFIGKRCLEAIANNMPIIKNVNDANVRPLFSEQ